jgi:hypothetical protein
MCSSDVCVTRCMMHSSKSDAEYWVHHKGLTWHMWDINIYIYIYLYIYIYTYSFTRCALRLDHMYRPLFRSCTSVALVCLGVVCGVRPFPFVHKCVRASALRPTLLDFPASGIPESCFPKHCLSCAPLHSSHIHIHNAHMHVRLCV